MDEWDLDDVTIRAERADDVDAITAVVADAFQSPVEAALPAAIRASENFVPEWSLVAELRGRIVGHVMVSYVGLHDEDDEAGAAGDGASRRVASLSPMSVAREFHNRGIGSALIRAVLARADEAGEPLVVLEGDPRYYARFGFEHSLPHGIRITLPEWAPAEAAQIRRLRSYDPALRGRIVYPPAFDTLDD
jgi:putative acetyltransferase